MAILEIGLGLLVGGIVVVLSPKAYAWVQKQTASEKAKLEADKVTAENSLAAKVAWIKADAARVEAAIQVAAKKLKL